MGDLLKQGSAMGGPTVISVENGAVNLKYRDHSGFCRLAAVEMLTFNDSLQFLEPLEEITPRKWHG